MVQTKTPVAGYPPRSLRVALAAGLGGMALIFFFATIDAVRLLNAMRIENKLLRDAALQRTNHLSSIRSSILLTHTYLGEYLMDGDQNRSGDYANRVRDAWSRLSADLANYHSNTLDEEILVKRLRDLLDQHWQRLSNAMSTPPSRRVRSASFYNDEILPLRTSVIEITTQLEGIDARQAASTEAQIQGEFERLGSRLSVELSLGLGAALLLGFACLLYIFRIEHQNRRRYEEVLEARKALEQLSARLVDAQENERRTISRELHDQVGQTLNAILVDAANLAKRIPSEDAVSLRYLDNIRKFADTSVNSIRDIALLLRPSMLDDLGLIPALEWQAREVARRSGIKVKVVAQDVPDSLADEVRTCIYRLVQEALHNISRHSEAKSVLITVREEGQTLLMSVEDDGRGFDPRKTRGLGMLGMEERVRKLGGRFEISSEHWKGTTLRAILPMQIVSRGANSLSEQRHDQS